MFYLCVCVHKLDSMGDLVGGPVEISVYSVRVRACVCESVLCVCGCMCECVCVYV